MALANSELSKSIHSNTQELTGEGSFPFAFLEAGGSENQAQIMIGCRGEYAIRNLTFKIVVIPNFTKISGMNINIIGLNAPEEKVDVLRKTEMKYMMVDVSNKETAVLLYFKSDNSSWNQSLRIVKDGNKRHILSYIHGKEGVLLDKKIDKEYPRNADGKLIIWSNVLKTFDEI